MDYAHSLQNGAMTRKTQYAHSLQKWSNDQKDAVCMQFAKLSNDQKGTGCSMEFVPVRQARLAECNVSKC